MINVKEIKGYLTVCTNEYFSALITSSLKNFSYKLLNDDIVYYLKNDIKGNRNVTMKFSLKNYMSSINKLEDYIKVLRKYIENGSILEIIRKFKDGVFFSREELVIYVILYDFFLENEDKIDNGFLTISLKEIHCKYRNATLKRFNTIDEETRKVYLRAFKKLSLKQINFCIDEKEKFSKCIINQSLLDYQLIKNKSGYDTAVKFSLGNFGEYLKFRKRNSGLLPISFLHLQLNQTLGLEIGLYLTKMIFMKRKSSIARKKGFSISVKKVLENIMFFDQKGKVTGLTYYEKLSKNNKSNNKILTTFERRLIYALEELKKYESISDYEILKKTFVNKELTKECAKITSKNYKNRDLQIYIRL